MAWWTDIATKRGNSPNHNSRNGTKVRGFVVHTANGNGSGVANWIMNPASRVSSTFVVMKDGSIIQTLDTALRPWTTGNSNSWTISAECEGHFSEPFTDAQIRALGRILKKANQVYGVRLALSRDYGLSGHRQHMSTACPGDARYRPLADVVRAASGNSSAPKPSKPSTDWSTALIMSLPLVKNGTRGAAAKRVQSLLAANGYAPSNTFNSRGVPDGIVGNGTLNAIKNFQRAKKISVDGIVGKVTYTRLLKG